MRNSYRLYLESKELKIVEHKPQAVLRNIKGRSVTLDLKCIDEKGIIFGVEVQKHDNDNHQKRVRYNMANLDTAASEKGIKFDELKDIYEIYISRFDVFGKNRMGDDVMCDLVQEYAQEYAEKYANKEKIKMLVELYKDGTLSAGAAAKKLEITDETFMGYVEEHGRQIG